MLSALFSLHFADFCFAATPHEEYKKIEKAIDIHKKRLSDAKKRESSILTEIEYANRHLRAVESDLKNFRKQLENTEARISRIEQEIAQHQTNIEKVKGWMKLKIRAIHRHGYNADAVTLFLNADNSSELMRSSKYLQYITVHEHNVLKTYKENLEDLNSKEKQLNSLRKELIKNRERVKAEEESLEEKKKQKEVLLASVKKEEIAHAKMLRELKEASNRILEIIRESEKTQEGKEETFSGKQFSNLKGRLPWPVNGKVMIPYGSQKDPQFNTPIFRSGTYIQSADDPYAKAVHTGKVVFAEWFKGYGQLVILNHGDGYHTLYGSLSEIFTKVGDIIKDRQILGRIGNSGILNSPGVYFELRYKGKPLDPMQWLRKR
jgi:septal ring factor EnvC (AmiA/AmiB activator)